MKFSINKRIIENLSNAKECFYANEYKTDLSEWLSNLSITEKQLSDTLEKYKRFSPLIENLFPVTKESQGIIESPLVRISEMQNALNELSNSKVLGELYLKMDSHLAIAGSVKARGGMYEVLNFTEELLVSETNWNIKNNYIDLMDEKYRDFFHQYTIQVGSTGNLGLSIGIISAKLGYKVIVHMSKDAKLWKKNLLREVGVVVKEYSGDYLQAVEIGRSESKRDSKSHFVDDENSIHLFLGYAVSAFELRRQLEDMNLQISDERPLIIYIPCGVGGAPGGITYGCKYVFGDNVYAYFVEPTQACCMILGMATRKHSGISVHEIGLTGKTEADGLAVSRPSKLVGKLMEPILDGLFTVKDQSLFDFEKMLMKEESIFLEPSACAGFMGYMNLQNTYITGDYSKTMNMKEIAAKAVHIVWATGGSMVPESEQDQYLQS